MPQTAQPCEAFGEAWEQTGQGTQVLISGVRAITDRDRLQLRADAPMAPRKPQKPLNIGLFDEDARNQLEMF